MKKYLLCVLVLSLVLSLAACRQGKQMTYTFDTAATDLEGLSVSAEEVWEEDDLRMNITLKNNTEQKLLLETRFVVEQKENDQWVPCEMREDVGFDEIFYYLKAGQTRTELYYVTFYYPIDAPGKYRFLIELETEETGDKHQAWVEFEVKK